MIELLAPGGSKEAIENAAYYGADAVYFGVGSKNARAGADNLAADQMEEIIDFLHSRSVKGYLALNILLRDHELKEAFALASRALATGVDGIIVQDLGLASWIHSELPAMPVHASTQMTITDEYGIDRAHELGLTRVVLPRELNAKSIRQLTKYAENLGIETEVFVHGALCVAYSGQCLISGIKRGRSANRGQCSQPCRLSYGISEYIRPYKYGTDCENSEFKSPLISPKDQSLIKHLPELIAAGVSSLKIEGRMRSAEYAAMVVSEYRRAIDQALAGSEVIEPDEKKLLIAFNRGGEFTDRHYTSRKDNNFVTGKYPGSFGFYLGIVEDIRPHQGLLKIKLSDDISAIPTRGDILSIRSASRETASAPIGVIEKNADSLMVKAFHPDVLKRIRIGEQVYQMSDLVKLNDIKKNQQHRIPLELHFDTMKSTSEVQNISEAAVDDICPAQIISARLRLRITAGALAGLESVTEKYYIASEKTLPEDRIKQQLAKTGATQFAADLIEIQDQDGSGARITIAELNSLRRDAIVELEQAMIDSFKITSSGNEIAKQSIVTSQDTIENEAGPVKNKQIDQAIEARRRIDVWYQRLPDEPDQTACGADCYILPLWSLSDNRGRPWIEALRKKEPEAAIYAWLPPAPQNEIADWTTKMLSQLNEMNVDGICSGHPGAVKQAGAELKLQIDSGLNITNSLTASLALSNDLDSVAFSTELTAAQLFDIVDSLGEEQLASTFLTLPIYGRQRLMSSIYCPVGHNVSGCRKCYQQDTIIKPDNAKLYDLCDQKNKRMILQTHPQFCTTDIVDSSLLLDLDMLRLPWTGNIAWRLHMLDESYQERIEIVQSFRKLSLGSDQYRKANEAAVENSIRAVADRITEGSVDRRRVIYE
ncbi:MAG: U32 family peptidase [Clostridiaceae bacterium]|nr:U32 family peptidase [Clostridiaceae bacterium]